MAAALLFDVFHDICNRPGVLVWPLREESIKDVADRCDPPRKGNLLVRKSEKISRAVESLMVGERNFAPPLKQGRLTIAKEIVTGHCVQLHYVPFFRR